MEDAAPSRVRSVGFSGATGRGPEGDLIGSGRLRTHFVRPLLGAYARLAATGVLERPLARRLFESAYLAYKRTIEAGPITLLRPLVAPGSTVVDVGANIGFFTLLFGRWVGPAGRVVAIEPEGRNIGTLRRRIRSAGLEGVVECIHAAAADRPGERRLRVNPRHPGDHRLSERGDPVPGVTIDDLTAADRRPISLLKIDVQGAESLVLAGARRVVEARRPAIFVEVDDAALRELGSSAAELIGGLVDLGYTGHTLERGAIGEAQPPSALIAMSIDAYVDVLFLPRREAGGAAQVNPGGTAAACR